jgi:flagellar biosynthesis chaperone FliJ
VETLKELNDLKNEIKEINIKIDNCESNKQHLMNSIKSLEEENNKLSQDINDLTNENNGNSIQLKNFENQITDLNQKIEKKTLKYNKLETEYID